MANGTDGDPIEKKRHAPLVEHPELRELERRRAGFNLFQVLGHAAGELRRSNVPAWRLILDDRPKAQAASCMTRMINDTVEEMHRSLPASTPDTDIYDVVAAGGLSPSGGR